MTLRPASRRLSRCDRLGTSVHNTDVRIDSSSVQAVLLSAARQTGWGPCHFISSLSPEASFGCASGTDDFSPPGPSRRQTEPRRAAFVWRVGRRTAQMGLRADADSALSLNWRRHAYGFEAKLADLSSPLVREG